MQECKFSFKAMGSPCTIRVIANSQSAASPAVEKAIAEIGRLEHKYSRYLDDSLLSQMNREIANRPTLKLDEETVAIVNYAKEAWQQSDGLFDVSSGVLRQVWDFKSQTLPTQTDIDACLSLIGFDQIHWQPPYFALPKLGMQLDFGGCVKEYAADAAARLLSSLGVVDGLVELGGDIALVGSTIATQGWPVAIRNPRGQGVVKRVRLQSGALASSGDYERCIFIDGIRYGHLLNPLTGWPVQTPASVSVVADSCLVAGTVSTVAMLKGEAFCLDWLEAVGLPYLCVFNDGRVEDKLDSATSA